MGYCRGTAMTLSLLHRTTTPFSAFDPAKKGRPNALTSDADSRFENDNDGDRGVSGESGADPDEVDRVCKVIHELFALDRNMEAALDKSGVQLSHDLVVDVLQSFKHARKLTFQFFCWGLLSMETFSIAIKAFVEAKQRKRLSGSFKDFCKQKMMGEAIEYFDEMVDHGCQPDAALYMCLIAGFGRQKKMDMVHNPLKEMMKKGCPPDGRTYNALIKLTVSQ
ncbi:hypothetical protein VNO78_03940 [Psophocarpus tetragonolobus]|uniref:Pentatricopeptide repeat-containing protein n=1 Tax=Psophocarpus tetragonolobus TaxID=3891 RepID=A0AAN9T1D5_PSOTE